MHRRRRWRERDETSCASRRWEGVGNEEDFRWVSCYGVRKGVCRAGWDAPVPGLRERSEEGEAVCVVGSR